MVINIFLFIRKNLNVKMIILLIIIVKKISKILKIKYHLFVLYAIYLVFKEKEVFIVNVANFSVLYV